MSSDTSAVDAASPIRVLLVTHHYTPERGAPVRRWEAIIERLTPLGFRFTVLAPPPHNATGRPESRSRGLRPGDVSTGPRGERIIRTSYRRHSTGLPLRIRDQVVVAVSSVTLGLRKLRGAHQRPHVVIGTVPGIPSMFAAWVLARLLHAKYVVEMRDAWPDLIAPSGMLGTRSRTRYGFRRRLRGAVIRTAHRAITSLQSYADMVVTTTETFAQVLRDRGQRHVVVVRNGTDLPPETPAVTAAAARERPGIDRPLRAVYLGTMGRSQCLDSVIRAAAKVKERGHQLEVRLIGRGAHVGPLKRLVEQTKAPVAIEGPIPHQEALMQYRWADTAIVALHGWGPFEWTIPSKLYEVMARDVPITAALAGEPAELVRTLGAGTVVRPDDPDALADLWSSWCEAGTVPGVSPGVRRWVTLHATWDVLATQYAAVLDDLVTR